MDNYLIYLIRAREKNALGELLKKYHTFILTWIKEVIIYDNQIDSEAVQNLAFLSFFIAIDTFDEKKGVFFSYAKTVVKREIFNYLKRNTEKEVKLISLEDYYVNDILVIDTLSADDRYSRVEEHYNILEEQEEVYDKLVRKFDELSRKVIYLKAKGFSNKEISKETSLSERRINYMIRKIGDKM